MSAADDHVRVQVSLRPGGLARQSFGVQIILSHAASFTERVRYYTPQSASDDWSADSPEGRGLAAAFAQKPAPAIAGVARMTGTVTLRYDIAISQVAVGHVYVLPVKGKGVTDTLVSYMALRDFDFAPADVSTANDTITEAGHGMATGAGPFRVVNTGGALPTGLSVDTNVWVIAVDPNTFKLASSKANAAAGTALDLSSAGTGTHTLQRGTNDVIVAQLAQGLAAVPGANYTATQIAGVGQTDTLRVVATAPAAWFAIAATQPDFIAVAQTHAAPSDVTIAADLTAILLADQAWYCAISVYNSDAYIGAVSSWTEANGRIYVFDTNNTACVTTPLAADVAQPGVDIGSTLLAAGAARTMGDYYADPALFLATGIIGRWLPRDPGSSTPKFKTLGGGIVGLTGAALTDRHKQNLRARRMNTYEQVLSDRAWFEEGTVFSNQYKFLNNTRNADWLQDLAQKKVLGALANEEIVPYLQPGLLLLENALRDTGSIAEAQGVLAPGWTVTAPAIDDIADTEIENGNLSGLQLVGKLVAAIHTAKPVDIVLSLS